MPTPGLARDKKVTAERAPGAEPPAAPMPLQNSAVSDRRRQRSAAAGSEAKRRLRRLGRSQSSEGSIHRDCISRRASPWVEADEVAAEHDFPSRCSANDTDGKSQDFQQDSVILGTESESDEPLWEMRTRRMSEEEAVKAATCALLYQSEIMTASMVHGRPRKDPGLAGCCYRSNGCWVPGTSRAKAFISI